MNSAGTGEEIGRVTPKFRERREESEVRNRRSQRQEFGRRGMRQRGNGVRKGKEEEEKSSGVKLISVFLCLNGVLYN